MRTTIITLVALLAGLAGGYGISRATRTETANVTAAASPMAGMDQGTSGTTGSMATDLGAKDGEYDKRFIDAMIVHHEGAIEMAEDARSKSERPEILKLADDIITAQRSEIAQMRAWRADWYGTR